MSDQEKVQERLKNFFPGYDVHVVYWPVPAIVTILLHSDSETVAQVSVSTSTKIMTTSLVDDLLKQLQKNDDPDYKNKISPAVGILFGILKKLLPKSAWIES